MWCDKIYEMFQYADLQLIVFLNYFLIHLLFKEALTTWKEENERKKKKKTSVFYNWERRLLQLQ